VRVGQAVDVVGQAGRPKTITGFATHSTPVLLAYEQVWFFIFGEKIFDGWHLRQGLHHMTESGTCYWSIYSSHFDLGGIRDIEGKSQLQAGCIENSEEGPETLVLKATVSEGYQFFARTPSQLSLAISFIWYVDFRRRTMEFIRLRTRNSRNWQWR
jgi:hypothetical protein